jgi:pantoate--beta-alanine ligase
MIIFKKANDLQKFSAGYADNGWQTGFVPTMGALHKGHISLIEESRKNNRLTVCSIFVNPAQFNDPKDFEKYPVTIENDILLLEKAGCDILFLPSVQEIYPTGTKQKKKYDLGYLETVLEGKFRPGHFQGVCMVIERLLDIVTPRNLYLGRKDYQQCMVIKRLIELTGLTEKVAVKFCPTLREEDGLAMSSRNMRLKPDERIKATTIYKVLQYIKETIQKSNIEAVKETARQMLSDNGFRPDYVEIADATDLRPADPWDGKKKIVALVAAFLNDVRLIDNMDLN